MIRLFGLSPGPLSPAAGLHDRRAGGPPLNPTALTTETAAGPGPAIALEAYPQGCSAMLAVCSDLDQTPDARTYLDIARFLNTRELTALGPGVGLEVGNSVYFDMPPDQFAWHTTDDAGRQMLCALMASGHVDVLHSFGDFVHDRRDAARWLETLQRHNCRLQVWVDHSKAPTNFGPDIMAGAGDVPRARAYHADLTTQYGIRYVWRGRTTGVLGQDVPLTGSTLLGQFHAGRPLQSARTLAKEAVKIRLGRRGRPRWQMHALNAVLRPSTLRDGRPVWEFLRSDPYWGGQSVVEKAWGVPAVLNRQNLDRLVERRGVWVWYTHLGKAHDPAEPLTPAARAAFATLAEYRDAGKVFVTTTHRLLRYLTVRDNLRPHVRWQGETLHLRLAAVEDPVVGRYAPTVEDVQGLCLHVPRADRVAVELADGTPIEADVTPTGEGLRVSLPWRPLVFPPIGR